MTTSLFHLIYNVVSIDVALLALVMILIRLTNGTKQ
jgi:hypothetical protein